MVDRCAPLGSGSPLGWDLHRWQRHRVWRMAGFAALYGSTGLAVMGLTQAGAGLWLVLGGPCPAVAAAVAIAVVGVIGAARALRGAGNGADKMALVVVTGTLLHCLGQWLHKPMLMLAGLAWTGGQLTLAYWTAGVAKLRLAPWRNGDALTRALTSYSWGAGWITGMLRIPAVAVLLAWTVMLAEALFPLALLLPASALAMVLAGFGLFHIAIALVMGLNTYPLAFAAAYPATLMLAAWLRHAAGLA